MKGTKTETRISKPTPCQSSPFGSEVRSVPRAFTESFSCSLSLSVFDHCRRESAALEDVTIGDSNTRSKTDNEHEHEHEHDFGPQERRMFINVIREILGTGRISCLLDRVGSSIG
jgi:hypothetical protein